MANSDAFDFNAGQYEKHLTRLGNYFKAPRDCSNPTFESFRNPWIFYKFFLLSYIAIIPWLQDANLLIREYTCHTCLKGCVVNFRECALDKFSIRCKSKNHEFTVRLHYFFGNFRFSIQDVFVFVHSYLDGMTLKSSAMKSSVNYSNSAPKWARFGRQVMMQRIHEEYFTGKFQFGGPGEILEMDEAVFGRKVKHSRGDPRGSSVWIFGVVERSSGLLLLFPVDNRYG